MHDSPASSSALLSLYNHFSVQFLLTYANLSWLSDDLQNHIMFDHPPPRPEHHYMLAQGWDVLTHSIWILVICGH